MCEWPLWKIQIGQLDENKIVHTCGGADKHVDPAMSYTVKRVNENSQNTMKGQRRGNNYNK